MLREQVKTIREFDSSLFATVYWALGGVFATGALLAGFGWWSNFKVYEADKKRLVADFTGELEALRVKLEVSIGADRLEVQRLIEAKNEMQAERLGAEVSAVMPQLLKANEQLGIHAQQLKDLRTEVDRQREAYLERIHSVDAELRTVEENVWDLKNNPGNVLITQGQGVSAALAAGSSWRLDYVLERMTTTLRDKLIGDNRSVRASTLASVGDRLKEAMPKAKGQQGVKIAELLEMLNKARVDPPEAQASDNVGSHA